MTAGPASPTIPPDIVDAAIGWYVRQASGQMGSDEQLGLSRWLAEHPDHLLVWQRLQGIGQQLNEQRSVLPPASTRSIFRRLPDLERRKAVRLLSWLLLGSGSLYLGRDHLKDAAFPADVRTAIGERREVRLADGTLLLLNTDSAVDIHFDQNRRRIRLRRGEIQIVTARDAADRPFWVETRDARLVPIGTRFSVHQQAETSLLAVSEGAVEVFGNGQPNALRVAAGEQLNFDGRNSHAEPLDESRQAWTDGMISAEGRRLDDLLAELGRYRKGYLGCTPEAGELRITGTWPLRGDDPTEAVLTSLERRLPVRIQRLTRYWVKVEAR